MSLDGLRAWIGELERKFGARTRIGLVLVAISIGGAGAAIYLALDVAEKSATKNEVRQLQTQPSQLGGSSTLGGDLESRVATATAEAARAKTEIAKLQLEVKTLQTEVSGQAGGGSKK